jgi:uncharacterized lipoprotein YmbA
MKMRSLYPADSSAKTICQPLLWIFLMAAIVGCARSQSSRFYLLEPISALPDTATNETMAAAAEPITIGIGPIRIPEYLNRPQIVTRSDSNELHLADYNRWAEPLDLSIPRVFAENLAALLGTDRVVLHPWNNAVPVAYQVSVEIVHLDGQAGGAVTLKARWMIFDTAFKQMLVWRTSQIQKPVDGEEITHVVRAESLALDALCREIAEEIQQISRM